MSGELTEELTKNPDGTDWQPCPKCVKQYNWLVDRSTELGLRSVELTNELIDRIRKDKERG